MVSSRFVLVNHVRPSALWKVGPVGKIMSLTLPWIEEGPYVVASANGAAEGWTISFPSLWDYSKPFDHQRWRHGLRRFMRWAINQNIGILGFLEHSWDASLWFDRILEGSGIIVVQGWCYAVGAIYHYLRKLASERGMSEASTEVLVHGANSVIGRAFALLAARDYGRLTISGGSLARLEVVATEVFMETGLPPQICSNLNKTVGRADIIIAAHFARETDNFIAMQDDLRSGSVVCLVGADRETVEVLESLRPDITVINGATIRLPAEVAVDRRYPRGLCDAFAVETMIHALEGCGKNDSSNGRIRGEDLRLRHIEWILAMGRKHGFEVVGDKHLAVVRSCHGYGS